MDAHRRTLLVALPITVFAVLSACGDGDGGDQDSPTGPGDDSGEANQPPTVSIRQPSEGADVLVGSEVTFEGSAEDPEDGDLSGDDLVWESDEDGELGTGTSVTAEDLSIASHQIALTATDSDGATGEAAISLRVRRGDLDAFLANDHVGCGGCTPQKGESTIWMNEGGGEFTRTDSILPETGTQDVALADLDGDEDLDAFVANGYLVGGSEQQRPNHVWMNDGDGGFTDSGQRLGADDGADSRAAAPGDFDEDGDLDVVVANGRANSRVYENDGSGTMSINDDVVLRNDARDVAVGDLDGDGDLDAVLVRFKSPNPVYINDGSGDFSRHRRLGGTEAPNNSIDLADLDGDGDLDAVDVLGNDPDRVWRNDGSADFSAIQELGEGPTTDVALGDVDGDGDPDAFLTKHDLPDQVWMNDGSGYLTDSGQRFVGDYSGSEAVALGDVDGDGDVDAYIGMGDRPDHLLLNDGQGNFTDSGQTLGGGKHVDVELGDLDGS